MSILNETTIYDAFLERQPVGVDVDHWLRVRLQCSLVRLILENVLDSLGPKGYHRRAKLSNSGGALWIRHWLAHRVKRKNSSSPSGVSYATGYAIYSREIA